MLDSALTLLALLPIYLIGTIPTGKLIAAMHGLDIHNTGSGNQGATNVARSLGKKWGLLTLFVDCGKGYLAIILSTLLSDSVNFYSVNFQALCGFSVVAGHCFSIPGKIKGGKGVATALGVFLAYNPWLALAALVFFSLTFLAAKIVSLASISSALLTPIAAIFLEIPGPFQASCAAIALLVIFRHKENLQRLIEGKEPRFQIKREPQAASSASGVK